MRKNQSTVMYSIQSKCPSPSRCDCEGVDPPHLSRPLPCRGAVEVVVDVVSHQWEDAVEGPPGREAIRCDPTGRTLQLPQGSMSGLPDGTLDEALTTEFLTKQGDSVARRRHTLCLNRSSWCQSEVLSNYYPLLPDGEALIYVQFIGDKITKEKKEI
ncbi:hypothetical protein J6590_097332, partial [Homalodisca vitripennis]